MCFQKPKSIRNSIRLNLWNNWSKKSPIWYTLEQSWKWALEMKMFHSRVFSAFWSPYSWNSQISETRIPTRIICFNTWFMIVCSIKKPEDCWSKNKRQCHLNARITTQEISVWNYWMSSALITNKEYTSLLDTLRITLRKHSGEHQEKEIGQSAYINKKDLWQDSLA